MNPRPAPGFCPYMEELAELAFKENSMAKAKTKAKDNDTKTAFQRHYDSLTHLKDPVRTKVAKELAGVEDEGGVPQGSTVHKWSEPGDKVEGILYLKKEQASQFDRDATYMVYGFRRLDENTGEPVQTVVLQTSVLKRELAKFEKGTWLTVMYIGDGEAKPGQNPPKLFRVFDNPVKTEEFGEELGYDDETDFDPSKMENE